ncbi:MAG: hypothetical protein J6A15_09875 [Clostridia bacterium]|nr:hypothetical protein [Clostridia bacterium]
MKEEKDNIQKIVDSVKTDSKRVKNPMDFVIGALLLIVGIFFLSRKVVVTTGFAAFSFFGYNLTSGLLVFPLIFGLIWIFYNPKSIGAKILTAVGAIFIVAGIIMNTSIHLLRMTLFDYIVIIGTIAAGIGILLRYYFKRSE